MMNQTHCVTVTDMHPPVLNSLFEVLAGENPIDKQAFVYSSLVRDGQECAVKDPPIVEQGIELGVGARKQAQLAPCRGETARIK
jgi:hypothetical protein